MRKISLKAIPLFFFFCDRHNAIRHRQVFPHRIPGVLRLLQPDVLGHLPAYKWRSRGRPGAVEGGEVEHGDIACRIAARSDERTDEEEKKGEGNSHERTSTEGRKRNNKKRARTSASSSTAISSRTGTKSRIRSRRIESALHIRTLSYYELFDTHDAHTWKTRLLISRWYTLTITKNESGANEKIARGWRLTKEKEKKLNIYIYKRDDLSSKWKRVVYVRRYH